MNSQATSKIVVGVGLAAVFGIGVSAFVLHAQHETQVAQNAPAPTTPLGPTAATPDSPVPAPADQTANALNAPAAAAIAVAPTPVAGTPVAKAKARKGDDAANTRVASASGVAPAPRVAPAPVPSTEPVASDSQITAEVKSQIATAAPGSSVDVTTTDGVVALAGSAPSQDAVDQAKQAAQRVAGVKQVDSSALTISNQISNQ